VISAGKFLRVLCLLAISSLLQDQNQSDQRISGGAGE
jgi:hypothetical protein